LVFFSFPPPLSSAREARRKHRGAEEERRSAEGGGTHSETRRAFSLSIVSFLLAVSIRCCVLRNIITALGKKSGLGFKYTTLSERARSVRSLVSTSE
jgi:hypothetical protein